MIKPITAGAAVALACIIYASVGGIAGAALFSLALLTILYCGLPLYTGRVGQAEGETLTKMPAIFLLNALGGALIAILAFYAMSEETCIRAVNIAAERLQQPAAVTLARSVLCGALMQTAVVGFKKGSELLCVFCVAAFVISGFEHSVANVFWVFYSSADFVKAFMFLLICAVGNAYGAKLAAWGGIRTEESNEGAVIQK